MSFCYKCGNKLGEEDVFCINCGTKIKNTLVEQQLEKKEATTKEFDETIIYTKAANLFRGIEGVGGKLIITDNRLIFKPHLLNVQSQQEEIPYKCISLVKTRNTLGLIPNGMSVITKEGKEYKFVIWKRSELINYINRKIKSI